METPFTKVKKIFFFLKKQEKKKLYICAHLYHPKVAEQYEACNQRYTHWFKIEGALKILNLLHLPVALP